MEKENMSIVVMYRIDLQKPGKPLRVETTWTPDGLQIRIDYQGGSTWCSQSTMHRLAQSNLFMSREDALRAEALIEKAASIAPRAL